MPPLVLLRLSWRTRIGVRCTDRPPALHLLKPQSAAPPAAPVDPNLRSAFRVTTLPKGAALG